MTYNGETIRLPMKASAIIAATGHIRRFPAQGDSTHSRAMHIPANRSIVSNLTTMKQGCTHTIRSRSARHPESRDLIPHPHIDRRVIDSTRHCVARYAGIGYPLHYPG